MNTEKITTKHSSHCVNIANSKPESLRKIATSFTAVRVYDGGHIGVAGQIGKTDTSHLQKCAEEALARKIPYPCAFTTDRKKKNKVASIIEPQKLIETANALTERIRAQMPEFTFSGKAETDTVEKAYCNSVGSELEYAGNNFKISLSFKEKTSQSIHDFFYGFHSLTYDETAIADDCTMLGNAYTNKIAPPAAKLPLALDSGLLFRFLIRDLIAETYFSNAGKFAGRLGSKLFSDKLTVTVDRGADENAALPFFDAEGTLDSGFEIIETGTLKGLFTNKRSAVAFNRPLSASAACEQFDSVPSYGAEGLCVKPNADSLSLLADRFIYVAVTSGGDIAPNGTVGLPVQLAFLVENGHIVGRLPELKITANIFDLLGGAYLGTAKNSLFRSPCGLLDLFDAVAKV